MLFISAASHENDGYAIQVLYDRNHAGALHTDLHRSHLHVIEFSVKCASALCQGSCASAAVHQRGHTDEEAWGLSSPVGEEHCTPVSKSSDQTGTHAADSFSLVSVGFVTHFKLSQSQQRIINRL